MLAYVGQEDFSMGAVRSVARHLIPSAGVYSLENGLLDADGSVYRRGGSEYLSNAVFGAGGLRWVWDGYLAGGQRTVFADSNDFGVLAADGVTPVNLGGAGLTAPVRAVAIGGMLFIPGGTIYAGSRKAADYSAGTVSVTQGSKVVTGAGTLWAANADAGMLLRIGSGRYYPVASVDSDTQVTLQDVYEGATAAGQAYALTRLGTASAPYRTASLYATAADRLVTVEGAFVRFSAGRAETAVVGTAGLGRVQPHVFADGDFHELPEGATGLGAEALRDLLVVFSTDGLWTISNMPFDLTDAAGNVQQSMQRTSQEVVLWGAAGVASYRGALVVPALDGVYLVDGVSAPVSVSDSITPLLVGHVRAGRKPGGGQVFRNHYFLPVLDAVGFVVDLLVCRLDRPVRSRSQTFFPWSWFRGHGGTVASLTQRVSTSAQPELLAAGQDGRVLKLTGAFEPTAGRKRDADGTVHRWALESRDFATGNGNVNTVRRVRARYELEDALAGRLGDAQNLLTNPSFESGSTGWDTVANLGVPAVAAASTAWAAHGSQSWRAVCPSGCLNYVIRQERAVAPGDTLVFGATRNVESAGPGTQCYVLVYFLLPGSTSPFAAVGSTDVLVPGVTLLSGRVVVPEWATAVRFELRWTAATAPLTAAFDAAWIGREVDLMTRGGGDNPTILGYYASGEPVRSATRWGEFAWNTAPWGDATRDEFVQMQGVAFEDEGRSRHTWNLAAAARHIRVRLESTDPAARLILRSLDVAVRPSAKDR